jgi:DnaK suppressor protein
MTTSTTLRERYSDMELSEFRTLIQQKLTKAKEEFLFYRIQLDELGYSGTAKIRSLDDAVGSSENEFVTAAAARIQQYVRHLENALLRIDNKVYGVCRATGKLIPKERLKAVPHATLSIEAKMNNLG